MRHPRIVLIVLAVLAGLVSCGESPVGPTQPPPPVEVEWNDTITGTILAGDSLEFRVHLDLYTNHRISLRTLGGSSGDTLVLTLTDTTTAAVLGEVRSAGDQVGLHDAMIFFDPPGNSLKARVVVRGARPSDHGAFEFIVRPPESGPEHSSSMIALGDTILDEWNDGLHDVDAWRFSANAGDELLFFVGFHDLREFVNGATVLFSVDRGQQTLAATMVQIDTTSFERNVAVIAIPTTGEYTVAFTSAGIWKGRYRLAMHRRERAPETAPAMFAVGDTVTEAMDEIADIDEFTFAATAGTELMFNVATDDAWPNGLRFMVDAGGDAILSARIDDPTPSLDIAGPPRWTVPATGNYRVRVEAPSPGNRAGATGAYRFELYQVNRAPETASPVLALGATMTGESIDRRGDIDEFTIPLDSGRVFVGNMVSQMGDRGGRIEAMLKSPGGAEFAVWDHAGGPLERDSVMGGYLGSAHTAWETGPHKLTFKGDTSAGITYSFRTYEIDPAPEVAAALVPLGSWVEGESLGIFGDIDRFQVPIVAGGTYALQLQASTLPDGVIGLASPFLELQDLRNGGAISRFVPSLGGMQTLTVAKSFFADTGYGAAYRFRVLQTNIAPETTDSIIAIGDTVDTESIGEFGDIDDFYFTASSADSVRIHLRTIPANEAGRAIFIHATDAETGAFACACIWSSDGGSEFDWRPSSATPRTYRFRISDSGGAGAVDGSGRYFLAITRVP